MKHSTVKAIVFFSVVVLLTTLIACTPASPKAMVSTTGVNELNDVRAAIAKDLPEAINAVNLAYDKKMIDGALNQSLLDYLDSVDNLTKKMIGETTGSENASAVKKDDNSKSAHPENNTLQTALKLHRDIVFIKEMFTAEKLSGKN
jgi:hypothetical protein